MRTAEIPTYSGTTAGRLGAQFRIPGWPGAVTCVFPFERRLQELADDSADSGEFAAGVTPVQAWAIGQAMLVGLQIYKRLAPRFVTPEVFERAFGLLAGLYQEQ